MTVRCDCRACAASAYVRLLHSAQNDPDAAHRQQAMDYLASIGPGAGSIGADGSCPGDTLAAPMLSRLYPDEPETARNLADSQAAAIAQIEREAIDAARHIAAPGQDSG